MLGRQAPKGPSHHDEPLCSTHCNDPCPPCPEPAPGAPAEMWPGPRGAWEEPRLSSFKCSMGFRASRPGHSSAATCSSTRHTQRDRDTHGYNTHRDRDRRRHRHVYTHRLHGAHFLSVNSCHAPCHSGCPWPLRLARLRFIQWPMARGGLCGSPSQALKGHGDLTQLLPPEPALELNPCSALAQGGSQPPLHRSRREAALGLRNKTFILSGDGANVVLTTSEHWLLLGLQIVPLFGDAVQGVPDSRLFPGVVGEHHVPKAAVVQGPVHCTKDGTR